MRVVDVSPRLVVPPRNGSSVRLYHLMRHLSARHEIRQYSQPNRSQTRGGFEREVRVNDTYREYRETSPLSTLTLEWCFRSWITTPILAGAALRVLRPKRLRADLHWADVCLVEFPWQFRFCRRERPGRPVVYVAHNVELDARASGARGVGLDPQRSRLVRYVAELEREALATADLVVAVSPDDRTVLLDDYGVPAGRLVLVPNGSDTEGFVPVGRDEKRALRRRLGLPERPTVLFIRVDPEAAGPRRAGLDQARGGASARINLPRCRGRRAAAVQRGQRRRHRPRRRGRAVLPGGGRFAVSNRAWWRHEDQGVGLACCRAPDGRLRGDRWERTLQHGEQVWVADKTEDSLVAAVEHLLGRRTETADRLGSAGRAFVVAHHDWKDVADDLEAALLSILTS